MSTCDKYRELMSAALDGELSEQQRAELEAHIASCGDCAAVFAAFSSISGELRGLEPVPEGFAASVMASIPARRARRSWRRYLAAAACLVLICAAAVRGLGDQSVASTMGDRRAAPYEASEAELASAEPQVNAALYDVAAGDVDSVIFNGASAVDAVLSRDSTKFQPGEEAMRELLYALEYAEAAEAPERAADASISLADGTVIEIWLSDGEAVCRLGGTSYRPEGSAEDISAMLEKITNS